MRLIFLWIVGVMRWERATPVALFLLITPLMSATGVARSQP